MALSVSIVHLSTDKGAVLDLAYLDSGHLVSAWGNKQVRVYDQRQDSFTSSVVGSHTRAVLSVATSDHLIFSAGEDRTVMVWDNRSPGQELFKLKVSTPQVIWLHPCRSFEMPSIAWNLI